MYLDDWLMDFKTFDKAVRMATDSGMWLNLDPIENSLDHVDDLHAAGHQIHVVTNPWGEGYGDSNFHDCAIQKMGWLSMYGVPAMTVRFGHEHKQAPDLDICIEDRIENVVAFARSGRPAVCHARPWNDPIRHGDVWAKHFDGKDYTDLIIRTVWDGVPAAIEKLLQ